MKKIFFTAFMAMVAIGGAFAQIYTAGSRLEIPCFELGATCALIYGPVGYNVPYLNRSGPQQGDSGTHVDLTVVDYAP